MVKHNIQKLIFVLWIVGLGTGCKIYKQAKTNHSSFISPSLIEERSFVNLCKPLLPRPGRSAICGMLQSIYTKTPIPKTAFYLMRVTETTLPAILTGPDKKRGDILGVSDAQGMVFIDDIPPGYYYILVWAPYNWLLAVKSPEDLTPRLIVLEPDKQYMLGIIYVPWP